MTHDTRTHCPHEQFRADVKVARLLDSGKFMAEIAIRCVDCNEPFRFIGVPAGIAWDHPCCSIDGLEMNAPIEPEMEKALHDSASYQMPEIPKRH